MAAPFAILWGVKFWAQVGTVALWLYGALFLFGPVLAYFAAVIPIALIEDRMTVQSVAGRITGVRRQESHDSDGGKATTFIIDIDCDDGTTKTVHFHTSKRKSPLLKVDNHLEAMGPWTINATQLHTKQITLSSRSPE